MPKQKNYQIESQDKWPILMQFPGKWHCTILEIPTMVFDLGLRVEFGVWSLDLKPAIVTRRARDRHLPRHRNLSIDRRANEKQRP